MLAGSIVAPSSVTSVIVAGSVSMTSRSLSYVPTGIVAFCRMVTTVLRSTRLILPAAGSAASAFQTSVQVLPRRLTDLRTTTTCDHSSVGPSVSSRFRLPVAPVPPLPAMLHDVTRPRPAAAANREETQGDDFE